VGRGAPSGSGSGSGEWVGSGLVGSGQGPCRPWGVGEPSEIVVAQGFRRAYGSDREVRFGIVAGQGFGGRPAWGSGVGDHRGPRARVQ